MMKEDTIEISYTWENIDFKNIDSKPAIYRFIVYNYESKNEAYYIGEAVNLIDRRKGYDKPGPTQGTNIWMNNILKEYKNDFQKINISYLKISDKIVISSKEDQDKELKSSFIRKFIENYLIVKAKFIDKKEILNREGRSKKGFQPTDAGKIARL
jgi:hypothetical protein